MSSKKVLEGEEFNLKALALCVLFGVGLWFLPHPEGLSSDAWHLLALFITTIFAIILKPLPMGAVALLAVLAAITTKTLTSEQIFNGFGNQVLWLVVFALFIARGFSETGLGNRLAYLFTYCLGKKTLGLSYGLMATDLIMAPAVPSVVGRCAGIVYPILRSIAESFDSLPHSPSAKKMGGFLTVTAFQVTCITSAMFMTAMAANPMIAGLLKDQGYDLSWGLWAKAAFVPGIVCLILVPYFIYKVYPPEIKDIPNAPAMARANLDKMGPISFKEWVMLGTVILLLVLWIFGDGIGIKAAPAAMIGVAILVLTRALKWKDLVAMSMVWETFFWFCILLTLSDHLNKMGVFHWASESIGQQLGGMEWYIAFPLLLGIYFYSHYLFASSTAHVASMFVPFLVVAINQGTPPMLAVFMLTYFSNLYGGLTHYSLTPAPMLYGAGYVNIRTWWKLGLLTSFVTITIFSTLGIAWWSFLGVL